MAKAKKRQEDTPAVEEPKKQGGMSIGSEVPRKYRVAKGKSITSKKGIRGEGVAIVVEELTGEQASLDQYLESGHIEVYY